ncbi:hypothetical protein [uncultured Nostoc sp.]|uniref:hypothetical protein n=1 Tax=uncultured Nostoc sp. TaxID=340711 RepID=UPI0035CCA10A
MTFTINISPVLLVYDFERSLVFYDATMTALSFPRCKNFEANGMREAQYCLDEDSDSKVLSLIETRDLPGTTQLFTSLSSFPAKNQSAEEPIFCSCHSKWSY